MSVLLKDGELNLVGQILRHGGKSRNCRRSRELGFGYHSARFHMRLAIVDDDDDVRTALARLLRALGHEVYGFASAEDFEAGTSEIECAIVDISLAGLSGLDLRERLRSRTPATPVVLMTGDVDWLARNVSRAVDTPLVTKPFEPDALQAAIAAAVAIGASA
jgi:FixJ family two-component response regulator